MKKLIRYSVLAGLCGLIQVTAAHAFNPNRDSSLVGWWPLDDGAGSTAVDASGHGNDGTLEGGPTWTTGWFGGALSFDGVDDYIDCGNDAVFNPTDSFSVSFWANISQWTTAWAESFLGKGGDGDRGGWSIRRGSGQSLCFTIAGLGNQFGTATPVQNEWIHISCIYDKAGDRAAIYIDGVLDAEFTVTGDAATNGASLLIGNRGNTAGTGPDTWAPSYFGGMLDDVRFYTRALTPEHIQQVMSGGGDPTLASDPLPANDETDVIRDGLALSWLPGQYAVAHDVYFGTRLTDVNEASRANPDNVLVRQGQTDVRYALGRLEFGQTYFWRIDEVNAAPDSSIHKGEVWNFTAEPLAYPLANVVATASIPSDQGKGPEKLVDGSGLIEGLHGTTDTDMWQGSASAGDPVRLQFEFDGVYKLHDLRVWNYNMAYERILGFGVKDVTIEYATDANEWTTLGDFQIAQAPGSPNYAGVVFDMAGIAARYVRMNVNSNWMTPNRYGLSEVLFSYIPVYAREPMPEPGANVDPDVVLSWRAGREAASHLVYFGADPNAVADGSAPIDTVAVNSYDLGTLDLGTTYYWKIGEVNEAETPSTWTSDVWDFSTSAFFVVDDFEGYNDDEGSLIYESWADGYNDNANGSQVGHDNPPYAEETIVHSGDQSMPMRYGQGGATTSEATLTLPAAQDWTAGGATALVLYFRGDVQNAPAQVYVKINGTRIDYPGGTAGLAAPLWKQWNIDLAALGNAARSVRAVTFGVSGAGTGQIYVDDIRLYREAPPQPEPPADPGTANLVALYTMEDSLADASGHGYDGTAEVGSSFEQGLSGYGKALVLDGTSGHATLPVGPLVQSLSSATFATWVNWTGSGSQWCRIFDFGTGEQVYMFLTPNSGGSLRFAITTSSSGGESQLNRPGILPGGWHHVAVTIDGPAMTMQMYLDGELVASGTTNTLPSGLGNTTQNYLGRSQWNDPYLPGSIDDFRIYDRMLSAGEIRYLVGDR